MTQPTKVNLPKELVGTWEEIVTHSEELAGRRVRVIVLNDETEPKKHSTPLFRPASGRSLLRHAGTWAGDDFEECLQMVEENRGQIEF